VAGFFVKRAAAEAALSKRDDAGKDLDAAVARAMGESVKAGNYLPFLSVLSQASALMPAELVADRLRSRLQANNSETAIAAGLIHTLVGLQRPQEAVTIADKAVATLPADNLALKAFFLRETALARYQCKQYPAAARDYEELLKIEPQDVESLNNYAYMLADAMGSAPKGIEVAQKALSVLTTNSTVEQVASSLANVYDTLAWAKYLNGQDEDALQFLKKSLSTQPVAPAYLHEAKVYIRLKRPTEARQAVEEGLKMAKISQDRETLADLEEVMQQLNRLSEK
jgi:tetratricopeptide (TPR) repeat protein